MVWLLALLWAGSSFQVLHAQFTSVNHPYDPVHYFNTSYVDMIKAHDGIPPPDLDVAVDVMLQLLSMKVAMESDLPFHIIGEDVFHDFVKWKDVNCSAPETDHRWCLREEDALLSVSKKILFTVYNYQAIAMEVTTGARLVYYIMQSEDIVLLISGRIEKVSKVLMPSIAVHVASVLKTVYKFIDILRLRYEKGTGSAKSLAKAADDVVMELKSAVSKIVSECSNAATKALNAIARKFILYLEIFSINYERIMLDTFGRDIGSFSPIYRYWDGKAMSYAINKLFRLRSSAHGEEASKIDELLANITEKHLGRDLEAAFDLAKGALSKSKKRQRRSPTGTNLPKIKLPFLGTITPVPLEDFNLLGVPTTSCGTREMAYEDMVRNILKGLGDEKLVIQYLLENSL